MGSPLEFGYYASALAAQGFLTLVFSSTFTADVVRTSTVDEHITRKLFSRALLTSVFAFLCALALGLSLTGVTHIPFSVFLVTAALAGLTPTQLFLWGVYSHRKKLTRASFLSFFGSVAGFLLGAICFGYTPTASSLLISPLVASTVFIFAGLSDYRNLLFPLPPVSLLHIVPSKFALRTFVYRCYWFLNANLIRWVLIFTGSQTTLGQLNRSEVLTSVPVYQLQNSIYNPFYPKAAEVARVDSGRETFRLLFTRASASLILLTWSCFTLLAVGIGDLVLLLLGSKWTEAASVAPLLIAIGAFQIPVSIFSGMVEVRNKFEKAYVAEILLLAIQVGSVIAVIGQISDLAISVSIMGIIMVIRFFWYAGILISERVLESRAFFMSTLISGCSSAILYYFHSSLGGAIASLNLGLAHIPFIVSCLLGILFILMISLNGRGRRALRDFAWLIQDN
jgi:hypothetical protein